MPKLFVYGDLRRGRAGHGVLERHNALFLGPARTGRGFRLRAVDGGGRGMYAALAPVGGPGVAGELYEVDADALAATAAYEDAAFHRSPVLLDSGAKAWAYLVEAP